MNDYKVIIDKFNDSHNIRDVIEICTGENLKSKSLCCPIHGGDNKHGSSIDTGKNIFTCWTSDCGRGLSPWGFVQKYYNLQGFKEVAEKVNNLFNTNIPIYEKGVNNGDTGVINYDNNFDKIYKVNQYLSDCKEFKTELQQHKHLLLNANTGLGKTFGIVELNKNNNNDYVFFLVSTRALAEDVANEYGYELFYDNDSVLPNTKYIVSTYKKIYRIQEDLNTKNYYRAMNNEFLVTYSVVVDEIHELMSKRNLTGGDCVREIESFILNSDDSILMSANTNNIYEAYKDTDLFSRYIKVESKESLYNSDKTYIYRIPGKPKQRYALLLDKMIENLSTHSNILLMEDSKENLKTYSNILSSNGIENVVINSDNKNDDEILEEYNSIVKDSRLKRIVVLCTSLINAGVNIQNDNTCIMCIQDRNQFDNDKAIQIFGRMRTDNNNTCILFLNQGEKNEFRSKKQYYINYYTDLANLKVMQLNQYYFNKYGLEPIEQRMRADWNLYKMNEGYKEVSDLIYIHNGLFKVDHVAIHEKSRLKWLKSNYYDDEFIMELFKDLKTRELKITTLAPITELEGIKEIEEDQSKLTLNKSLENIMNDVEAVKEFHYYIRGVTKPKDFTNEHNRVLYEEFKNNKDFRIMKNNLKSIHNELLITKDSAPPISTMLNVMREYQLEQTKKERDEHISNIKRVEIYNKQFPLGFKDIQIQGDDVYYIVRKSCDCFVSKRNSPSKTAYNNMISDYIKLNGFIYKDGCIIDEKGKKVKKIKPESIQTLFNNCILAIYNCSDNLHLYSLK